jgi:hypothetical protein
MVKFSRTTLEMGFSVPVTTAGAVPLTAYTVRVAVVALPKNPAEVTIQLLNVWIRPFVVAMSLIWKTPARLVFGPCSGVPAIAGVVESRTTRPGAAASGPGWKVGLLGSLKAAV